METLNLQIGKGSREGFLQDNEVKEVVSQGLATLDVDNKRVLVLIPDRTRTMPMPFMFRLINESLGKRAATLDYLIALGTHPPLDDEQKSALVGQPVSGSMAGNSHIFNHGWDDPANLATIGAIPAVEINELTGGLLSQDVQVSLNKLILEYDQLIICGPVFPHEVVGFSGGNKYLFPGIAGPEIINFMHWLGALITSYVVIGSGYTRIRAVIDRAAAFIDKPVACFSLVVEKEGLSGIYFGSPQQAWQSASELSAQVHIQYIDKPSQKVLSVMPKMYDDLWTAAKGMYKMEPAIADGGEVVIYAPHIDEVSYTHGKLIDQIGYHCRDFFLAQWDKYKDYPGSVLAHSTHVKGLGTYDPITGIEKDRIQVTLATGIPPERCRRINLGYRDPSSIHIEEWQGRESEGMLVVPRAGEMLYRLKNNRGE